MRFIFFALTSCLAFLAVSADINLINDENEMINFQDLNEIEDSVFELEEFDEEYENEVFEDSEEDFEEDKYNRTARKLCWRKLKCDFKKSVRMFRKSIRNCRALPNKHECQKKSYYEFRNATSRMTKGFLKCMQKVSNKTQSFDFEESYSDIENSLNDFAETELNSNRQECHQKYKTARGNAYKLYQKTIKECKTSECKKLAKNAFQKAKKDARAEWKKCLKSKNFENFELNLETIEEFNKDKKTCLKSYRLALQRAYKTYCNDLKKCKSNNEKVCKDSVLKRYKEAKDLAKNTYNKCVKNSSYSFESQPEEFLEMEDFDLLIDETADADWKKILECKKKFDPELQAIRQKLFQDMRNCVTSPNKLECIRKVSQEAIVASLEVAKKIRACVNEKF